MTNAAIQSMARIVAESNTTAIPAAIRPMVIDRYVAHICTDVVHFRVWEWPTVRDVWDDFIEDLRNYDI